MNQKRAKYIKRRTKGTQLMVKECVSCKLFKPDHSLTCVYNKE